MDSRTQGDAIQLTSREQDIIECLLLGYDIAQISKNLNIAPRTVKSHLGRVYLRFGIMDGVKRVKLANLMLSETLHDGSHCESQECSERERLMIELVAKGLNNRQLAAASGVSEDTIKNKLRSIYDRLGLSNRLELALWYKGQRREELAN